MRVVYEFVRRLEMSDVPILLDWYNNQEIHLLLGLLLGCVLLLN
ncbi:hypothetical protein [Neobacillus niacini]|nr:hypothetical protein [Neobacillus niacini]